jgi:hypothetical protein
VSKGLGLGIRAENAPPFCFGPSGWALFP